MPALVDHPLEPGATIHADVTVLHLLECQADVERTLSARASGPTLAIALRGPLHFSGDELARLAPEVSLPQLDAAVRLLRDWSKRFAGRVAWHVGETFVGVTPWTTLLDLRRHLDGLTRHELALDPIAPLVLHGRLADRAAEEGLALAHPDANGFGFRFQDEAVGSVVAGVLAASPVDRREQLRRALDRAAGVARGDRNKHLRVIPAPRYDDRRPARSAHVDLHRGAERATPRARAARAITAVRGAAQRGATELVIGGADPTGEWYLEDLVRLARSLGFLRVVLETSAADLDPREASALADAGVVAARVTLASLDEAVADRLRGTPSGLARTLAGCRALLDAGVALEVTVPLAPGNRGELAKILEALPEKLAPARARVERVEARRERDARTAPLSLKEVAAELAEGARAAARHGIAFAVAPDDGPPPCMFTELGDVAPALRLTELSAGEAPDARHARIPLCDGCGARHVCPGPPREALAEVASEGRRVPPGEPAIPPTRERERVLRELKSVLFQRGPGGKVQEHRVLRVNFHCNQACDFCFVSRELPPPEDELLRAELEEVAARGASLAISGGEPTLNPLLPAYLRRTVELGIQEVQLQTNAIKMSDPAYTAELVAAGLRFAFVSLHGTTAATSDRVTAAPGTFVRTVAGIKNLVSAGVTVCLNFVLCAYNASELAAFPDFVADEFVSIPGARVEINFSFVAAGSENVPRDTGLMPRFSDVAWALGAALDRARARRMNFLGFDSQCGVPACFLPEEVRAVWFAQDLPADEIDAFAGAFRKGEACSRCSMARRCYGLRAAYADTYGTGELRPIEA